MLKTKISVFSMILLLIALSIVGCSKKQQFIHFDGYYSNEKQPDSVAMFIQFYADGTVTSALPVTVNHVMQVSKNQLDKDNVKECTIRGKYTLKGNTIKYTLVDSNGSVDFNGEFRENKLILKVHSNINGRDSENAYDFYKWVAK